MPWKRLLLAHAKTSKANALLIWLATQGSERFAPWLNRRVKLALWRKTLRLNGLAQRRALFRAPRARASMSMRRQHKPEHASTLNITASLSISITRCSADRLKRNRRQTSNVFESVTKVIASLVALNAERAKFSTGTAAMVA